MQHLLCLTLLAGRPCVSAWELWTALAQVALVYPHRLEFVEHLSQVCLCFCVLVKRRACARGSILGAWAPISRAKFLSTTYQATTAVSLDRNLKKETEEGKKENSRISKHKTYSNTGILLIDHFVLSFTKKVIMLHIHRDLMACVVVCTGFCAIAMI